MKRTPSVFFYGVALGVLVEVGVRVGVPVEVLVAVGVGLAVGVLVGARPVNSARWDSAKARVSGRTLVILRTHSQFRIASERKSGFVSYISARSAYTSESFNSL